MSKSKQKAFKRLLSDELRGVADVLSDAGLVRDTSPLRKAAGDCTRNKPRPDHWDYVCEGLSLLVEEAYLTRYKNTIPGTLTEIEIELTIRAKWSSSISGYEDPFENLEVDCRIGAQGQGGPYVCTWHLDRNIGNPEDESRYFVHPCYHFQFGGRRLPRELSYGRFLFVEPPRLAHPPLDAILAVDFVLTNYFPNTPCS